MVTCQDLILSTPRSQHRKKKFLSATTQHNFPQPRKKQQQQHSFRISPDPPIPHNSRLPLRVLTQYPRQNEDPNSQLPNLRRKDVQIILSILPTAPKRLLARHRRHNSQPTTTVQHSAAARLGCTHNYRDRAGIPLVAERGADGGAAGEGREDERGVACLVAGDAD